jgi:HK97 family phage portal protein
VSLWSRAIKALGSWSLPAITANSPAWSEMFGPSNGLPPVTERSALTISSVHSCINLIAGSISAMTVGVFKRELDGERDQLWNDDLWWVLNEEFLPRWSAANGWEYLAQSLLLHGDGFAVIRRAGAKIIGLEPVHPLRVSVLPTPDRMRLIYVTTYDTGEVEVVDQDDMLHVAGFGFDGYRGISPLRYHLRNTGAEALATQEYSARFFANNARPDFILSTEQKLNPESAQSLRASWEAQSSGVANAHRVAILGQGTKPHTLSLSAEDSQLLETRKFSIEEIARIYGVPPFMIGHTEKTTSWGSGVDAMGIGFVRFTLRQHLNKFQAEINRKFFRTSRKFVEFDTFELERADMKSLFEGFRIALGRAGEASFMTTDEVRRKLNLKRKPGGDVLGTGTGSGNAQQTTEPAGA